MEPFAFILWLKKINVTEVKSWLESSMTEVCLSCEVSELRLSEFKSGLQHLSAVWPWALGGLTVSVSQGCGAGQMRLRHRTFRIGSNSIKNYLQRCGRRMPSVTQFNPHALSNQYKYQGQKRIRSMLYSLLFSTTIQLCKYPPQVPDTLTLAHLWNVPVFLNVPSWSCCHQHQQKSPGWGRVMCQRPALSSPFTNNRDGMTGNGILYLPKTGSWPEWWT